MQKMVAFSRERRSENARYTDHFIVNMPDMKATDEEGQQWEVEEAFRAAVDAYLWSDQSNRMLEYTSDDYNWGDAMASVPEEIFKKYGIEACYDDKTYSFSGGILEITVNQDEVLCRDYHHFPETTLDEIVADSNYTDVDSVRETVHSGDIELFESEADYLASGYSLAVTNSYTRLSNGRIARYHN